MAVATTALANQLADGAARNAANREHEVGEGGHAWRLEALDARRCHGP
jgi:hypothetical protein